MTDNRAFIMKSMIQILFPILSLLACQPTASNNESAKIIVQRDSLNQPVFHPFGYHLQEPDETFALPYELEEISGLTISADGKYLLAVNDELGIIYYINKTTGEVEKKIEFRDEGDYEGIEVVGDKIYVVKSNGNIYEVLNAEKENQETIKHKFFLTKANDLEALGFDKKHNRLLLGCKGMAGAGDKFQLKKAIYAFDLGTNQLQETPIYTIELNRIHQYLETDHLAQNLEKLWEFFDPGHSELGFSPSAIAVHPITDEIYITSSVGKLLLILNRQGKVLHIEKLKKKVHAQPEGLCFDEDGTMYISNEGKGGEGRICRFRYKG